MVPALQLAEAGTGHGGLPLAAPLP
jgi:hypothetical protein